RENQFPVDAAGHICRLIQGFQMIDVAPEFLDSDGSQFSLRRHFRVCLRNLKNDRIPFLLMGGGRNERIDPRKQAEVGALVGVDYLTEALADDDGLGLDRRGTQKEKQET